jgi:hypothetical protein
VTPVFKDFPFLDEFLKMRGIVIAHTIIKDMLVGTIDDRDSVNLDVSQALYCLVSCIFPTSELIIPEQTLLLEEELSGIALGEFHAASLAEWRH